MLTDFQKEIIQKVKDHWNLVPKTETGITRWQLMPAKVALIVELFNQSKLSAEEFTKETGLSPGLISKFAKGKLPNGKKWDDLAPLLNPEKVKKEKETSPEEIEKKEILLKKEILAILNRDKIVDIGLRDETIIAELSSYPKRFIVTILKKLFKEGRLESFLSEDKYIKYRINKRKDVSFRKEKKDEILNLLEKVGLGESRGLSPREIGTKLNLTESFGRELFAELVNEKLIISTGLTKGKKYVVSRLQKEAEKVLEDYNEKISREWEAKRKNLEEKSKKEVTEEKISPQEILPETEQNLKEEPKFSLGDFLAARTKNDILDVINSLPLMNFGDLIKMFLDRNLQIHVDAFYRLSLDDLRNHKS